MEYQVNVVYVYEYEHTRSYYVVSSILLHGLYKSQVVRSVKG